MVKKDKYLYYATIADSIETASLTFAALEDYGGWQLVWGGSALCRVGDIYKCRMQSPVYANALKALGGTACLAAAVGSALTFDPKNAKIFSSVSLALFSSIAAEIFRKKSKLQKSGLKYALRSEQSLEKILEKEELKDEKRERKAEKKTEKLAKSRIRRFFRKIKVAGSYTLAFLALGMLGTIGYVNRETYPDYFKNPLEYKHEKVTKDDAILKYTSREKGWKDFEDEAEERLELLVESDMTELLGEKVYLNTGLGKGISAVIMSRNDGIEMMAYPSITSAIFRSLSGYEKLVVERFAEGLGQDYTSKIDVDADYVKKLAKMFKENFATMTPDDIDKAVKNTLVQEFGMDEDTVSKNYSDYSAYIGETLGLTMASPMFQLVLVNKSITSPFDMVFTYGHEAGHALIIKNSSLVSIVSRFIHMFDKEKPIIEETGCNIIGAMVTRKFMENHLDDKELIAKFQKGLKAEELSPMVEIYRKAYEFEQNDIGKLQAYIRDVEFQGKAKGIIHYTMNTARLSIIEVYSGTEEVTRKLSFISENTDLKGFLNILGKTNTFEELDIVYKQFGGK